MDFMHDGCPSGRGGRLFNVIDNFNRQGLTIAAELSLPAVRVICSLKQIIELRSKPEAIRRGNGLEYISHKLAE